MNKMHVLLIFLLIIAGIVSFFALYSTSVKGYSCISSEQNITINNIDNTSNLYNVLNNMCSNINQVNNSISDINTTLGYINMSTDNKTSYYYNTINDINNTLNNINSTFEYNVGLIKNDIEHNLTNTQQFIQTQVDDRLSQFRNEANANVTKYMTSEEFQARLDNFSYAIRNEFMNYQQEHAFPYQWVFFSIVAILVFVIVLYKTNKIKIPIMKDVKPKTVTIEELITNKELKAKIENITHLISIVNDNKLITSDNRIKTIRLIQDGFINDEKTLSTVLKNPVKTSVISKPIPKKEELIEEESNSEENEDSNLDVENKKSKKKK